MQQLTQNYKCYWCKMCFTHRDAYYTHVSKYYTCNAVSWLNLEMYCAAQIDIRNERKQKL